MGAALWSLFLIAAILLPGAVQAGWGERLSSGAGVMSTLFFSASEAKELTVPRFPTLHTMSLPKAALNAEASASRGGGDVVVVDDSALLPDEGPAGTIVDIVRPKNATISIYVVREGDTIGGIAELFDVSANTIRWANDIPRGGVIRVGQTLVILPVTGVRYVVKKGDTLASIAKARHGDSEEIASFNGLAPGPLAVGTELIIPDGEIATPPPTPRATQKTGAPASSMVQAAGLYLRPIVGGKRSQGIHGYNGVDIAAPVGTAIISAAAGEVLVSRQGGWNGGYGSYIVIRHENGSQTLYAHNSSNIVGIGQQVVQGQVIGYVGSTGRSTGPHLHFEIRGGPRNPF